MIFYSKCIANLGTYTNLLPNNYVMLIEYSVTRM